MRFRFAALAALVSCMPVMAFAQTPVGDHNSHGPAMTAPQSAPGATGTVNAVDAGKHTINLTHGPIPALGWPAMTMDFGVAPSVDLSAVKTGDAVAFTVSQTPEGIYLIDMMKKQK